MDFRVLKCAAPFALKGKKCFLSTRHIFSVEISWKNYEGGSRISGKLCSRWEILMIAATEFRKSDSSFQVAKGKFEWGINSLLSTSVEQLLLMPICPISHKQHENRKASLKVFEGFFVSLSLLFSYLSQAEPRQGQKRATQKTFYSSSFAAFPSSRFHLRQKVLSCLLLLPAAELAFRIAMLWPPKGSSDCRTKTIDSHWKNNFDGNTIFFAPR